jgi:SPP1 gp7 family putative phage head morphogenesis protein
MLCREIKKAIIEDDIFGLIEPKHDLVKIITVNETPGKEAFKFSTSQDKVSQFMKWVKDQERKGLLQTTTINTSGTPIDKAWTDQYIQDSYKRGVTRARYEMGAAGMGTPGIEETGGISASMSTPFHMDRVGMLYARTFEDLKGITAAMDSAISRILSQGMVDGDGPRSLAGKIVDATGVSRRRAMTLARTEIIRAHHSAMVQEYKNWAVEGVVVKAEWVDAGFNVCPECAKNNGKIFDLNEIEGMIPVHPNCRCIALPTMPEKGVKTVGKVQEVIKPIEERIPVNTGKGVLEYMENNGFRKLNPKEAKMFAQKYKAYMNGLDISELDSELMALQEKYGFKWTKKSIEDTAFRKGIDVVYTGEYNGSDIKLIRSFYKRDAENWVEHELFKLPEELQGKGMSRDVLATYYKQYKNAKINFVSTHANIDVGGYAWGKYGFEVTRDQANDILKTFNNVAPFKQKAKEVLNTYFIEHPKAATFPMNEWANTEFGKSMLLGSNWQGQLNLMNQTQREVFENYLFKK